MDVRIGDEKERLRRDARARRDACVGEHRAAWSAAIARHGVDALRPRVHAGVVVSAYWPMRSEADPRPLARALEALGARLALPAFEQKRMLFRAWQRDEDLVPAGFQTSEPPPSAPPCAPDVVLAPLLAYDARGARLGWGKGYYDTALGRLDAAAARGDGVRPFVCGIAFSCQQAPEVPLEPHDRRLDAVLTELGFHAW